MDLVAKPTSAFVKVWPIAGKKPSVAPMKCSSRNLKDPGIVLPLPFPIKVIIEFRPGGKLIDHVPIFYSADPETAVDETVWAKGWDRHPGYLPSDIWVDGGI
jgi:hypothetical protein